MSETDTAQPTAPPRWMVMHPKLVGDQSVMAVLSLLVQAGYPVLLPFGENTRFDLAVEEVDGVPADR